MRTIIISDIHGCFEKLNLLLNKLAFRYQDDRIIFLGDLIDYGPESYDVILMVMDLKLKMQDRCIIIMGEHEKKLLQNNTWDLFNRNGHKETVRSFQDHQGHLTTFISWLEANALNFYEISIFQCAHAGIQKEYLPLNDEDTLLNNSNVLKDNMYDGKLTIIGHHELEEPTYFDGKGNQQELPYSLWKTLPKKGIICIDTKGYKRKLTALVIRDSQYLLESVS